MEKNIAIEVTSQIDKWMNSHQSVYELSKIDTINNSLYKFQQWADGKPLIAAYHVTKIEEESYYLLFIDWHRNDNIYLVVYVENKSTTAAEIHRTEHHDDKLELVWNYMPLKRDGKNSERKAYFKQTYGSCTVRIPLPTSPIDIEEFLNKLYTLCRNRIRADRIVDIFDF
jgi:hypothetical protein